MSRYFYVFGFSVVPASRRASRKAPHPVEPLRDFDLGSLLNAVALRGEDWILRAEIARPLDVCRWRVATVWLKVSGGR
eukprot:10547784-Alexandrium_andersonii.AAC.1